MALKQRTEVVHIVDYFDLDAFIEEACGIEIECQQIECWGNNTQHRFVVKPLRSYEKELWEEIRTTKVVKDYSLRTILNGLCTEGKLEEGVYLIMVCW